MRQRIVITNPVHAEVVARLEAHGDVDVNASATPWSSDELATRLAPATAMMGFMTDRVDERLLACAPRLRIVACALKGYDAYDVDACSRRGVWLSVVPDLLTEPTAELAIGLAIALARNVRSGDTLMRQGGYAGWRAQLYGVGLRDSTVAVVGMGMVGRAIVDRLAGFGCAQILSVDPQAGGYAGTQPSTLDEAFAAAHFVFLALPLTRETRLLIGPRILSAGRRGQFVINIGRGSVVDEVAVAAALESQQLGGYAADVFACEDWGLPDRSTDIPQGLLKAERSVLTPHLGSAVADVRLAIEHRAADNIIAVLAGAAPRDGINAPHRAAA